MTWLPKTSGKNVKKNQLKLQAMMMKIMLNVPLMLIMIYIPDHPTNAETSAQSDNNYKKATDNRKKVLKEQ